MNHVTVIVLNWNQCRDTLACLASLARVDYPALDVLVVDNGSANDSVRVIRERFPHVTVLESGRNLGFTGGNNVGMSWALGKGADFVLLLNNDTEVASDFLKFLMEAMECDPRIGMAGSTICYSEQPQVIWSVGGSIDWHTGQTCMLGIGGSDMGQFGTEPRDVDFLTGCVLLVKAAVLKQVGLLDDRFFAYYEDAEWCWRARRAGFRVAHVPLSCIWHKISPQAREASPQVHYYMTRNRLLFLGVTGAGARAWIHTLLNEYLRTLLSWSLLPKWRGKRRQLRGMFLAIGDAARKHWGSRSVI